MESLRATASTGLTAIWQRLSLASRFAFAAGVVMFAAAWALGAWVADQIEEGVLDNTANATAHYIGAFLNPISTQINADGSLSVGAQVALEEILESPQMRERIASYKIWGPDGVVIAASEHGLVGEQFQPTLNLRAAWGGNVQATFEDLTDPEDVNESALGLPLLEIYMPINEAWSGKTIAVAEFYEINGHLHDDLLRVRRAAWRVVLGIWLIAFGTLYLIVLGGSRLIQSQKAALDAQLNELRDMSERVRNAAGRAATSSEQTMRRIGADLHDGPAQDLAFAALRLDQLARNDATGEVGRIKGAIDGALKELRNLSRGLQMPDISGRPADEIIARVADAHAVRSGNAVSLALGSVKVAPLDDAQRICLFRFVQEGLNNASRHGGGRDLVVRAGWRDGILTVGVADDGPGFATDTQQGRLGLSGLRDRIESLGGTLRQSNRLEGGALLEMELPTGE